MIKIIYSIYKALFTGENTTFPKIQNKLLYLLLLFIMGKYVEFPEEEEGWISTSNLIVVTFVIIILCLFGKILYFFS